MKKIMLAISVILLLVLLIPLAPQAQTPVDCDEEYVVDVGDTLSSIAEATLNDPLAYPALVVLANAAPDDEYANIDNPNVIEEGWTICIPSEEELPELLAEADPAIQAVARQAGINVPPPFENTLWALVGYGDPDDPTLVEPGTVVTAQFADDGTLTGSGGCNAYNSTYEIGRNDRITIQTIASTQAFCADGMDQEQFYLAALEKATAFQVTPDGFLQIEYKTGVLSSESLFFVPGQADLKNTQWVLQAYGDPEDLQTVEPATTITAVFTGPSGSDEGTIIGFGGCNSYSTNYAVQDNQISVQPVLSTMAFCEVGSDQESIYLNLLGEAETVQIAGKRLLMSGPNGVLVFSSANLPLEQVLWTLESFGGPGAQQAVPAGVDITALFVGNDEGDGGTGSGSAGCNTYNATYEKDGRQLSFGPALTTLMACETGMEVEQAFLTALGSVERYQVLGDQLRLFFDGGEQVITFRANRTPLEETYWQLTAYGDLEAPQYPADGVPVTAVFEKQLVAPSGVVAGSTGCNSYSATYAASLTQVKVNPPINTLAFCEGAVGDTERAYLQGLASAESYAIMGNTLQIVYDDGEQALNFVASQPPVDVPAPTAVIQGPAEAQVGDTVTFSGSGSQSDVGIAQYSWGFGDGVTAEGETVDHIYGQAGGYTVRLTVVDQRGVSSSTTGQINISAPPAQGPTAVIEGPTKAFAGQDVTFQGGNSIAGSTPIVVYAWSVGGVQSTSGGADVSFTTRFDEPGVYEVILTVTDQEDLSDSASLKIEIFPKEEPQTPPTAVIEGPTQAVVGEEVTFRGGNSIPGSTPIVVYAWGIDGPRTASSPDVSFTTSFDQPGVYNVSLTVTDQNGLSDTSSLQVEVTEREEPQTPPTAVIEGPGEAFVNEEVTFQGGNSIPGSSAITGYAWDFGNGQTASGVSASTVYTAPSTYQVSLTVTDENGLSNTASASITINLQLEGMVWVLDNTFPDTSITAEFGNGGVSGSAGCNTYTGNVSTTRAAGPSNAMSIDGLITTQMVCEEPVMTQEQTYLAALGSAQSYAIAGNTLTISFTGGTLTYQAQP